MRSARFGCRARGSRRRARGGDFALHEAFHRSDCGQFALVDDVAAIGIKETAAVGAGVQIEPEGPRAPEHIDVPIGEARVVKVDETREAPVVQDDVWQAVVAVEKRVRSQFAGGLSGDAVGVCGGDPRAELRVEAADDRARDEPVCVRAAAGQIFDDLGAEAEFVERGAHARFVGECAGGRGLREQGVAACALGAECVDARLG